LSSALATKLSTTLCAIVQKHLAELCAHGTAAIATGNVSKMHPGQRRGRLQKTDHGASNGVQRAIFEKFILASMMG